MLWMKMHTEVRRHWITRRGRDGRNWRVRLRKRLCQNKAVVYCRGGAPRRDSSQGLWRVVVWDSGMCSGACLGLGLVEMSGGDVA